MPAETSQRYGYVLLVLFLTVLYIGRSACAGDVFSRRQAHPYADFRSGPTVVELSGDTEKKGIYYLPSDTPVRVFLETAGVEKIEGVKTEDSDRILVTGMTLNVRRESLDRLMLTLGIMGNDRRFALDLPMVLNTVGTDDLMRVDGIGGKTAAMIIETRHTMGGFKRVDDLMEVKGIGMKKLDKLKKYFCVESRR